MKIYTAKMHLVPTKVMRAEFREVDDAIQYNCAISIGKIDFIDSRHSKDFKKSIVPILNPQEAIGIIKSTVC